MATTYPRHEFLLSHSTGFPLLRYTHERPDAQYLLAKGEKFDEDAKQWVPHPIGIGYYKERSFTCTPEQAAAIVAEITGTV